MFDACESMDGEINLLVKLFVEKEECNKELSQELSGLRKDLAVSKVASRNLQTQVQHLDEKLMQARAQQDTMQHVVVKTEMLLATSASEIKELTQQVSGLQASYGVAKKKVAEEEASNLHLLEQVATCSRRYHSCKRSCKRHMTWARRSTKRLRRCARRL
jgi:chromosome segregation ATPase